jgi:arsenical pump membrane protein
MTAGQAMPFPSADACVIWSIAALVLGGIVVRPWRLPEALWAVLGAAALVGLGVLPWSDALDGVRKGLDVYLFLAGMMLLSEVARQNGLFDWLAAVAVRRAQGSPHRLFMLVYAVGTVVTVVLSNDATAVVLTPAVYAAARAAGATPLPYLFVCAFVANAASFVLPISNPANLVIFDGRLPHLAAWLAQFGLPSALAIGATYAMLRITQHRALQRERIAKDVARSELGRDGRIAACGIAATAIALLLCSAFDVQLGLPTALCGGATAMIVLLGNRAAPMRLLRGISWGILPLVAGLFVVVEAIGRTGVIARLAEALHPAAQAFPLGTAWALGIGLAFGSNLTNNLPAGLFAGALVAAGQLPEAATRAVLIGIDLGPNLSVTGSLATILWLVALRREGLEIGAWRFLRVGLVVMPPALVLAIGAALML